MQKSLISDTELIRGDSSDIYMFSTDMAEDLSQGWDAEFALSETVENPNPIISRSLPLNDGSDGTPANSAFIFQILPHESELLEPNKKYWVGIQVRNVAMNYTAEIAQFKLKIKPQIVL